MKTTHKIKRTLRSTIINKVLPLSLCALLLTSCSVSEPHNETEASSSETALSESVSEKVENTLGEITEAAEITEGEYPPIAYKKVNFTGDKSSDEITQADFNRCKEVLEASGTFPLRDKKMAAYDIDYDGQDELIVFYAFYLLIFEKSEGEITESYRTTISLRETSNIELDLKTYSDDEEKYPYSALHFDNGTMTNDAVVAIKYDSKADNYYLEYIISWGKIEYGGNVDIFNHAFFRKGWDYTETAADLYDSDISQEEFLEIYNKYEGLPPWDTYVLEYDLIEKIA